MANILDLMNWLRHWSPGGSEGGGGGSRLGREGERDESVNNKKHHEVMSRNGDCFRRARVSTNPRASPGGAAAGGFTIMVMGGREGGNR